MTNEKRCTDHTPSWFVGHWRDWHRGHGCDQDDGQPRSEAAKTEIVQHAENADTDFLTDAELGFLRASTTSGDTLLVRALDERAARRAIAKGRVMILSQNPAHRMQVQAATIRGDEEQKT